ncbi:4-hydroxy-3-methylbut-2-enyl diphosphate reductase [Rosettibacter firmus]|uniref:4-hydroxy-3-methylbut-2-enyl diphosphate reductase n=1 Tax=Rosettibacter firmus TaxID=3111522 RepID=UPI00336C2998
MKKFDIPDFYKSSIISLIKEKRRDEDKKNQNFTPTKLDFGPVEFLIARHFGFCYGVENAIEIAYKAIEQNPGKRIFLLSEMIHNPHVNNDLQKRGIQFIMDNHGNQYIQWDELKSDDIIIIPAFGTTVEIENLLREKGFDIIQYNTTCPFVEKVWNRAEVLGKQNYTIIIHGKAYHEETKATFSHTIRNSQSVIIRNINEAKFLSEIILNVRPKEEFYSYFAGKYSANFDVERDLKRIGVVNQTTMLASETQEIADLLRDTMIKKYGEENLKEHFADTRDTLCYATNNNQSATIALKNEDADFAIVIGGYNSSNTSHLAELLSQKFITYLISDASKIYSDKVIFHFDLNSHKEIKTENYIPQKEKVRIAITSGASSPDSIVDDVIRKLLSFFENTIDINTVLNNAFGKL